PLVEIGDPTTLGVVADVFDRDAAMVRIGAEAHVSLPAIEQPLDGHVTYIAPSVSSTLRTVPVRIELDHPMPGLRPGLFGRATISLLEDALVLPSTAVLVRDGQHTVVYIDEGNATYARRDVQIGPSIEGQVHVISGLQDGERVVVDGALLIDG